MPLKKVLKRKTAAYNKILPFVPYVLKISANFAKIIH